MSGRVNDQPLKSLLLIVGLSCAGKSTLIQALRHRTLPREIESALPEDAPAWTHAGKEPGGRRRLKAASPAPRRGKILHCDITCSCFPELLELRPPSDRNTYCKDDQPFRRQLADADDIFAVIVRTPRRQLLDQVVLRSLLVHVPPFARPLASRYVAQLQKLEKIIPDCIPNLANSLSSRWVSRSVARAQYAKLLELYGGMSELDALHREWASWLRKEAERRVRAILHVEPVLGAHGEKSFRLLSS